MIYIAVAAAVVGYAAYVICKFSEAVTSSSEASE